MFFKPPPIKKQISQYVSWKAIRYPVAASNHERALREFFKVMRVNCVKQATPGTVDAYLLNVSSTYHKNHMIHVLRQFYKYWTEMGLLVKEFKEKLPDEIIQLERESFMHIEQAIRVQKLTKPRGEGGLGFSLRQTKLKMETEDNKVYHLKQIHRWAKYDLRKLSPDEV